MFLGIPVRVPYRTLGVLLVSMEMMFWGGRSNSIASAIQADKSQGPFQVVDVLFEDYEGWPSQRLEMRAGGEVVLNFRMEGFERRERTNEAGYPEYQVSLQYEVELRDPNGVLVAPLQDGRIQQTLGVQDDNWRPLVRWSAVVPAWAPPGNYTIRIRVKDEIGEQQAEQRITLQIRGEAVPAADTLQAEGLVFARSPDGPWSSSRYFALRDPVYVRFKLFGYRISPDNRVWVEQDWMVLDEEGRIVIHKENAVEDQLQNFYPPRFLTTSFHVELDNPKPGPYLLRIALRDRIGEQTYSQEAPFTLRP